MESFDKSLDAEACVILTGAGGMLGSAIKDCLETYAPQIKIITTKRTKQNKIIVPKIKRKISLIFHCAGSTDADFCERHPRYAYSSIVENTKKMVKLAQQNNCKLFYPQSFLIYDGKTNPIDENCCPNPISIYGKYKLKAEEYLIKNLNNFLVVRMGGFFGGEKKDKNFVGKFYKNLKNAVKNNQKEIIVGDRRWQPTYTKDLAYNCLLLLGKNKEGIYSMATDGNTSFFSVAEECVRQLRLSNKIKIMPDYQKTISKKDIAQRPYQVTLSNSKLKSENLYAIRPWKVALAEYLNSNYFQKAFYME